MPSPTRAIHCGAAVSAALLAAASASASTHTINWMSLAPVPFGSPVPNNSTYFLPGVGNVDVSFSFAGSFAQSRLTTPVLSNGSVTDGGDTYQWGDWDSISAVNWNPAPPVHSPWTITFTFSSVQAAGSIYLGVAGLGATSDLGTAYTTATVHQNGHYLGEYAQGNLYGSNQFSSGAGWFSLQNTVTGPGGQDPWWNTRLAVTRIDDAISSLTVEFWQLPGDGVNLNIGVVPGPGCLALLGLMLPATRGGRRR